jgi:tetratricopeptide (TPR) repeat protein
MDAVLGMFLMVAVLPALVTALVRGLVLLALVLLAAAATNPSDESFAYWISSQENVRLGDKPSVSQWFSAMYKTAMALVFNEKLTWKLYNAIIFSVVYVPTLERYAFGCFGSWRWADSNARLLALCQKPWVIKVSRGGIHSSVERYMQGRQPSPTTGIGAFSSAAGLRSRVVGSTPLSSPLSGMVSGFQSDSDASLSDRDMRAKALHCKIRKDWKEANRFFREAAALAVSPLSRANYELEAAWCVLEESDRYPDKRSELVEMIQGICEVSVTQPQCCWMSSAWMLMNTLWCVCLIMQSLSSSGYFDDAARAVAELALRLKRRFPLDCQKEEFAKELGLLYVQAKNVAEAGGNMRTAADNGLRAANIYADAKLWALAEECFETVGDIQRADSHRDQANESYGNAVLCRIGQVDMVGAEQLMMKFALLMDEQHHPSDIDMLLSSLLKAYDKWSPQILEAACKRYDAARRLLPWQVRFPLVDGDALYRLKLMFDDCRWFV